MTQGRDAVTGVGLGDRAGAGWHRKGWRDLGKGWSDKQEEVAGHGRVTRQG